MQQQDAHQTVPRREAAQSTHRSGIALLTPEMLHYGMAVRVIEQRQKVLDHAYVRNPERFTHARPKHPPQPTAVWINPPTLAKANGTTVSVSA